MTDLAAALRELASLVEARSSVREALCDWHLVVSGDRINPVLVAVARRLDLGADTTTALRALRAFGADGASICRAITNHVDHGGSLAATLRSIGAVIEERDRLVHEARAASTAARLSGRLLAALAIGSVVLVGAWRGAPTGTVVMSSGAAAILAGCGTAWMRRLQPRVPSGDHPVAALADLVAALLDGGMSLGSALDTALGDGLDADMTSVVRRVRLGMSWSAALERSRDPAVRSLAVISWRALNAGLPVRAALTRLAADLREQRQRECTILARRAPVLLVLPLTLCFLPAFGLVMVAPLLRAVTG